MFFLQNLKNLFFYSKNDIANVDLKDYLNYWRKGGNLLKTFKFILSVIFSLKLFTRVENFITR